MFKLMGKEINVFLGAQTILIWTYALKMSVFWGYSNALKITFDHGSAVSLTRDREAVGWSLTGSLHVVLEQDTFILA